MRIAFASLLMFLAGASAGALDLMPGDAVVADPDERGVFLFDLGSGVATAISVDGALVHPSGVAVNALGEVFVADPDAAAIFQVDPSDGAQTLLCQGAPLLYPTGVSVTAGGDLLVADPVANAIFVLATDPCAADVLISGAPLLYPSGVREEPNGDVLVADPDAGAVYRFSLDPPELVTEGDLLLSPRGVAVDGADALVVDPVAEGVVRVAGGFQSLEVATDDLRFPTDLDVMPMPEPGAAAGLLGGSLLLAGLRRRRR